MQLFDRPARHTASPVTIVVAAVAALAVLVMLIVLATVAPHAVPGYPYYYLNAEFTDVGQIAPLSEVRIAGQRVGQVKEINLHGGHPVLRLQFLSGTGPLRSDTTAHIRLKGLLGAKFVDVSPGQHGRVLRSDALLPVRQTSPAVDLLDALQTFDVPTRRNLQSAVRGLGQGFLGRGLELNDTLRTSPGLFENLQRVSGAVLARSGAAARFAPSLESLAAAYDPVRGALASGFQPQARVLQAFEDRRADLERTLQEAPSALAGLRRGLDASTPLLAETAGLARATTRLTRPAPAALGEASLLLRESRPALRTGRPVLRATAEAVPSTLSFLQGVNPVIDPAIRVLRSNIPGLRELGPRQCDFLNFARNWRSGLGYGVPVGSGDPSGGLDRGEGIGPLNSFRVVVIPPTELEALTPDAPSHDARIKVDAYPGPCVAASERVR